MAPPRSKEPRHSLSCCQWNAKPSREAPHLSPLIGKADNKAPLQPGLCGMSLTGNYTLFFVPIHFSVSAFTPDARL
jgi:hypothetical protein